MINVWGLTVSDSECTFNKYLFIYFKETFQVSRGGFYNQMSAWSCFSWRIKSEMFQNKKEKEMVTEYWLQNQWSKWLGPRVQKTHLFFAIRNCLYSTLSNTSNEWFKHNGVQKVNQIKFVMDGISIMAFCD